MENDWANEEAKLRRLVIVKRLLILAFVAALALMWALVYFDTQYQNWGGYLWGGAIALTIPYFWLDSADTRFLSNILESMEGFAPQKSFSNKSFGIGVDTNNRRVGIAGRSKKRAISIRMIDIDSIRECDVKLKYEDVVTGERKLSGTSAVVGGLMFGPMGALAASVLGSGTSNESHTHITAVLLYFVLEEPEEMLALDFLIEFGQREIRVMKQCDPYKDAHKFRDMIVELMGKSP